MNGKRTNIDFSKHEVKVIKHDGVLIHHLKKPKTNCDNIKFINAGGILAVTGDYGNWIFCREFHPSAGASISDGYWHEKLKILSTQEAMEFDSEATKEALSEKIKEYKEEKSENLNQDVIDYYEECINMCDEHELDYTYFAYREQPKGMDYEDVILLKDYKFRLKAVFDGFEVLCSRMSLSDKNDVSNSTGSERIICAAVWYKEIPIKKEIPFESTNPKNCPTGLVFSGHRHGHCIYTKCAVTGLRDAESGENEQGFLTSKNRFVSREEALIIALRENQVMDIKKIRGDSLYSEDLY